MICNECGSEMDLEGSECTFDRDGREYIYDVWVCPKCGEEYMSNIRYVE